MADRSSTNHPSVFQTVYRFEIRLAFVMAATFLLAIAFGIPGSWRLLVSVGGLLVGAAFAKVCERYSDEAMSDDDWRSR